MTGRKNKSMIWVTMIYTGIIFGHSATPAVYSSQESGFVTEILNKILSGIGITAIAFSDGVVRKLAHFTEYTGLGILMTLSLLRYPLFQGKKRWLLIPVGFVIACIDEGIQYFTPGRDCNIKDVCLDTCGVAFGVAVSWLCGYLKSRGIHGSTSQGNRQGD